MIDLNSFLQTFEQALDRQFGGRVWFLGLQGSYGRGEATQSSDLDLVVILDTLSAADVLAYNAMLEGLPHREKLCGFLSGKGELLNWEPSDLFQFYHDTKPIRGSLDGLLPLLDDAALARAIKIGACNLFHGCVHNMLYEKSGEILAGLYKSAAFLVQAVCCRKTGNYVNRAQDMLPLLQPPERQILEHALRLKQGGGVDFDSMSEALLTWSQSLIRDC